MCGTYDYTGCGLTPLMLDNPDARLVASEFSDTLSMLREIYPCVGSRAREDLRNKAQGMSWSRPKATNVICIYVHIQTRTLRCVILGVPYGKFPRRLTTIHRPDPRPQLLRHRFRNFRHADHHALNGYPQCVL